MDPQEHAPTDAVRIAVVGAGWAGIRHLEAAETVREWIDPIAICDTDLTQSREVGARFDIANTTSTFDDLLADVSIEVIDICTPHASHAPLALAAMRAGKHVLVEKPIATDSDSAMQMIAGAANAGVALGVAEHAVYEDSIRSIKGVLDAGTIGNVVTAIATWGFQAPGFSYPGRRSWLTDPTKGGTGTWMLQGIHHVAQLRYLFGEVDSVFALQSSAPSFEKSDIEATVTALMMMRGGFPITITQSSELVAPDTGKGITVFGETGMLSLAGNRITVFGEAGDQIEAHDFEPQPIQPYARELEAFATHIRTGVPYITNGVWEAGSLAVIEAGYESIRTGLPTVPVSMASTNEEPKTRLH
jgi:predicted dehydrogenase